MAESVVWIYWIVVFLLDDSRNSCYVLLACVVEIVALCKKVKENVLQLQPKTRM